MKTLVRGLVGFSGTSAILIGMLFWLRPLEVSGKFGLSGIGALGQASLRADLGGFFAGVGALMLWAAVKDRRDLLLAPVRLICLALAGRGLSLALTGPSPELVPPIVVEAVTLVILLLGRRTLASPQA